MRHIQFTESFDSEFYDYSFINLSPKRLSQIEWHWFADDWELAYKQIIRGRFFNVLPATSFDIVLFPMITWKMTQGLQRLGGSNWGLTSEASKYLGREPDYKINWTYMFGTGTSSSLYPIGKEFFREEGDTLFSLNAIDDIFFLQLPMMGDQTLDITLFGLQPSNVKSLINLLSDSSRSPLMAEVLQLVDLFISFSNSDDLDYFDGITIKSRVPLSNQIDQVINDVEKRFEKFQVNLKNCDSVPKYLAALSILVDGEEESPIPNP